MLFIIEGTDRSGKTTLAHAIDATLTRLYPDDTVTSFHAGPPSDHPLDAYERPLFDYRPGTSRHVICDRWHIGECVYPDVFHRSTLLTAAVLSHIEAFLRSRGALLVHVTASIDTLRDRFDAEERAYGQCPTTWDQLMYAHRLFRRDVALSCLPKITVDQSDSTMNELRTTAESIVTRALAIDATVVDLNALRTYIGPPRPRVLFLGDVRHEYRRMNTDIDTVTRAMFDVSPLFMPFKATTGAYLLTAINRLMLHGDIGIMNANDIDDPYKSWKTLQEPITIALGTRTWKTVKSWAHGAVPHPQFIKRFYYGHMDWYRDLIEHVIDNGGDRVHERP